MKTFKFLICLIIFFTLSCNTEAPSHKGTEPNNKNEKEHIPKVDPDGYREGRVYTGYFITGILEPNELDVESYYQKVSDDELETNKLRFENYTPPKRNAISLYFRGEYNGCFNGSFEKFREKAAKLGEVELGEVEKEKEKEKYFIPHGKTGYKNYTTSKCIKEISVQALTEYNDNYPAGSDISNICIADLSKLNREGGGYINIFYYRLSELPIINDLELWNHLREDDSVIEEKASRFCNINFTEAAKSPKQRLKVKVIFDDDSFLEKTMDVNIEEYEYNENYKHKIIIY